MSLSNLINYQQAINICENKGFEFIAVKQPNKKYLVSLWKWDKFIKYGDSEYEDSEEAEFNAYMVFADKLINR